MNYRSTTLGHLKNALVSEFDDPESWIADADLETLIRLCLVKTDGQRRRGHVEESLHLYDRVSDNYRERGGYVDTDLHYEFFHVATLYDVCRRYLQELVTIGEGIGKI